MSVILSDIPSVYTVSPKEVKTAEFIDAGNTGVSKAIGLTDISVTDVKSGETKQYASSQYAVIRVRSGFNGFSYHFTPYNPTPSRLSPLSPEFKVGNVNATGGKRNSKSKAAKSKKSKKSREAKSKSRKNAARK